MSQGSPRITVRIPYQVLEIIDEAIEARNKAKQSDRPWDRTDWIMSAIGAKLSQRARSTEPGAKVEIVKTDENQPREVYE